MDINSVISHLATLDSQNKFISCKVQKLAQNLAPKDCEPTTNSLRPSPKDAKTQTEDASESIKVQQENFEW